MDGFNETNNILVFAATNLVKFLDPALVRSGRFDKKVFFDLPNSKERSQLCQLYFENMNLPMDLSFDALADRTAGLSGADIANIANQAKINAIQNQNCDKQITEADIQKAIDEVLIGREKRERVLSLEERTRVSFHEAGHCLMGYILKYTQQPVKVSIIPRGEAALGFSQQKPENKKLMLEHEILAHIAVLLGGRCAEKLIYDNVSTGASDDIEKVSLLVKNYTNYWGMSQLGPINLEVMGVQNPLGKDLISRCKDMVIDIENQTLDFLKTNQEYVKKLADKLLHDETLTYNQIKQILPLELENSGEINLNN